MVKSSHSASRCHHVINDNRVDSSKRIPFPGIRSSNPALLSPASVAAITRMLGYPFEPQPRRQVQPVFFAASVDELAREKTHVVFPACTHRPHRRRRRHDQVTMQSLAWEVAYRYAHPLGQQRRQRKMPAILEVKYQTTQRPRIFPDGIHREQRLKVHVLHVRLRYW